MWVRVLSSGVGARVCVFSSGVVRQTLQGSPSATCQDQPRKVVPDRCDVLEETTKVAVMRQTPPWGGKNSLNGNLARSLRTAKSVTRNPQSARLAMCMVAVALLRGSEGQLPHPHHPP